MFFFLEKAWIPTPAAGMFENQYSPNTDFHLLLEPKGGGLLMLVKWRDTHLLSSRWDGLGCKFTAKKHSVSKLSTKREKQK